MSGNQAQFKNDFEIYKKKIRESKKTLISILNDSKNLCNSFKNNVSLLNFSQTYTEEFNQNEISDFNIILSYKPDLLSKLYKKLLNNFDQIISSLYKNNHDIRNESKNIENSIFSLNQKYKESSFNINKLYNNHFYLNELHLEKEDNEFVFCYLLDLSRQITSIERMYVIFQLGYIYLKKKS
jgi:hypothetical protein